MSFLTLEDINTTNYKHQGFYWHKINTANITETTDYTDVKYDCFEVSRQTNGNKYYFTFKIFASNYVGLFSLAGGAVTTNQWDKVIVESNNPSVTGYFYMGPVKLSSTSFSQNLLQEKELYLKYNELGSGQLLHYYSINNDDIYSRSFTVNAGLNEITGTNIGFIGYLFVGVIKSNFKFDCTQTLTNGKVNTVLLGTDADYKPSGAMVGDYVPYITVLYGETEIPVQWNTQLNDYTFDIDLTNREKETDIPLTIYVEVNEVLNQTETEIRLHTRFETINNLSKVNTLFTNGGIGRLGADITLTGDLTVQEDIYLIGNDYTIDLDGHKIIVPSDKTFKASNVNFRNGVNTIQQNTGSKVGLTDCTFGYCTGLGSVIDCQVDLDSLENPTDFTTTLTRCIIGECETAILHGGELTVTDCTVEGIISDPSYPYFLYQTDGNATILQSEFSLISDTQISTDIEFNSCIFICGETAQINGYSHQELQNNNITQFLETQRNSSVINVTYLYTPISDYITLYSEKGYCHSVSDVDYVFKTNVTPTRSE